MSNTAPASRPTPRNQTISLTGIDKDIESILLPFMAVNSETATAGEKQCEEFLLQLLGNIPYFQKNTGHFGAFPIKDDELGRAVTWALVKGKGPDTVILLHHNDVVGVEDFKILKHAAFSPALLAQELVKIADGLQAEAKADLLSGEYLFGRGCCDMKGGGAIQFALLKRYAQLSDFRGNLIVLSLPDEENLSAGMRAAITLLTELKEKFALTYVYAINSEPHQRKDPATGLFSEGSVGKMLAFVYVRGVLAHVGKIFEGLNPLAVLTEIAGELELSPLFSDNVGGESAPPPTWLYLRDRKLSYDVSIPLGAGGCVSIITLDSAPPKILSQLQDVSHKAFATVITRMNERYAVFCNNTNRELKPLPWKPAVTSFASLVKEALEAHGDIFLDAYELKLKETCKAINTGELTMVESGFVLTEFVYDYINDLSPRVVIGFIPPYYPNVSNLLLDARSEEERTMAETLSDYTMQKYGQKYEREYYYTGISDLSYFSLKNSARIKEVLANDMPLFGKCYSIPLEQIESLSMPCINIGPWGKDFHKLTERVYKPDLFERTPDILNRAIQIMLNQETGA